MVEQGLDDDSGGSKHSRNLKSKKRRQQRPTSALARLGSAASYEEDRRNRKHGLPARDEHRNHPWPAHAAAGTSRSPHLVSPVDFPLSAGSSEHVLNSQKVKEREKAVITSIALDASKDFHLLHGRLHCEHCGWLLDLSPNQLARLGKKKTQNRGRAIKWLVSKLLHRLRRQHGRTVRGQCGVGYNGCGDERKIDWRTLTLRSLYIRQNLH